MTTSPTHGPSEPPRPAGDPTMTRRAYPERPGPWQSYHVTSLRTEPCLVCRKDVDLQAVTTTDDDAAELLRPPQNAWFGFIHWPSGQMRAFVCCSSACASRVLADPNETPTQSDVFEPGDGHRSDA